MKETEVVEFEMPASLAQLVEERRRSGDVRVVVD